MKGILTNTDNVRLRTTLQRRATTHRLRTKIHTRRLLTGLLLGAALTGSLEAQTELNDKATLGTILSFAQEDKASMRPTALEVFTADNGDGTYTNPITRGDYPDTDIIRVGNDYYMISSSFACMPGIPVCHSRDLVNWRVIGHAYDSLTFLPQYSMERTETAYGRACWAPTIRYWDGWFYIGVNLKNDRFIMCKSQKPEGPYTMYSFKEQLYDPGMFIDDDGRKYVTHGMNNISITELNDEGTEIKTPGDKGTVILRAPESHRLYFEGCHMYKRNGWYYIFNPAQGYNGYQMVSRSRNLYGPYETRILLDDDLNYAAAGAHQGGYVETAEGESWAFTFQDRDYMGRDLMLYPMRWVDDWPVVGLDPDTTRLTPELRERIGRIRPGKGVVTYRKPYIKGAKEEGLNSLDKDGRENGQSGFGKDQFSLNSLNKGLLGQNSLDKDQLSRNSLVKDQQKQSWQGQTKVGGLSLTQDFSSLQQPLSSIWEWSHVPIADKWELVNGQTTLRLHASPAKGYEWARNSLTQKCVAPACTGTAHLDVSHLQQGDFAGHGIMGSTMLQQGVMRTRQGYELQIHQSRHVEDTTTDRLFLGKRLQDIYLRTEVTKSGTVRFSYSLDGTDYKSFGQETASGFWRFLGLRFALCCYRHTTGQDSAYFTTSRLRDARSGYADFIDFTIQSPWQGNHYDALATTDFDLYDDREGLQLVRPQDYTPVQYLKANMQIQKEGIESKNGEIEELGKQRNGGNGEYGKVEENGRNGENAENGGNGGNGENRENGKPETFACEHWVSFFNLHFPHSATKCSIELKARLSNVVIELREGSTEGPVVGRLQVKATGGKWSRQTCKVNIPEGRHKITFCIMQGLPSDGLWPYDTEVTQDVMLKNFCFE